jgi:hypothetical protein
MKTVSSGQWHYLIIRKPWAEKAVMRFEPVIIHINMVFINSIIPVVAVKKRLQSSGTICHVVW